MKVFTIGFTKKTARKFFETLRASGAKRVVDVRLNNVSQLAGFAKRDDLAFFLKEVCGMDYVHLPALAPTQQMLDHVEKLPAEAEANAEVAEDGGEDGGDVRPLAQHADQLVQHVAEHRAALRTDREHQHEPYRRAVPGDRLLAHQHRDAGLGRVHVERVRNGELPAESRGRALLAVEHLSLIHI